MSGLFGRPRRWVASSRPELERLEDRLAPARILVHTFADGLLLPIPANHVAPNLRSAINSSAAGDEIDLDNGVYTLTGELPVTHNLLIRNGAAGVSVIDARQHSRVFEIGRGASLCITGLTVTGGRDVNQGAGILNSGTLVISNCTITGNSTFGGGGIMNAGQMTLSGSTITGNTASGSGGGIFNVGTLAVTGSTITGNSATAGNGGGILNAGTMTVTASVLANNTAGAAGGGVYNVGTALLANDTIAGNRASNGGGIYNAGTLVVTNGGITGNSAPAGNGGGIFNAGTLTVTGSTFSGNVTGLLGGGVYNTGALTVTNSTLTGNSGTTGGGLFVGGGSGTLLVNDTVARNQAKSGGGLALSTPAATTRVWNTLVALNVASTVAVGHDVLGSFVSLGHNLIGNTLGATGFNAGKNDLVNLPAASIGLGQLASNGGPTQTLRLLPGSVAIDRGDDGVLTSPLVRLTTDQRGSPRRSGAHVDVGAYESP